MFRSTKPRTRALLSVPVAIAAAAAISVPLMGVAQATHTSELTINPTTDSASVGQCNPYTVTLRDQNGQPIAGAVVDVVVTERTPSATQDVDFCTAPTGTTQPGTPADASTDPNPNNTTTAGNTDRAEFVTNQQGQFVFGIIGTEPGAADILVFYETDNNDQFDSTNQGEESVTAEKFFTAGTVAGDSAATANNANCVDATPETDINVIGDPHTITVRVTNNDTTPANGVNDGANVNNSGTATCGGDPVVGVTPVFTVDGTDNGNDRAFAPCTATNNAGEATCTYTGQNASTDTITVYVNQTAGNATPDDPATPNVNEQNNPATQDPNEPGDVVSKTYIAAARTGLQLDVTCNTDPDDRDPADPAANNTFNPNDTPDNRANDQNDNPTAEDCINPTADPNHVFTARVTRVDGGDADTARDPIEGVLVRFTENGADSTVAPTECTTAANGTCTVTLTEGTPRGGEVITVTGTIVGQNAANDPGDGEITVDTATKTFANEDVSTARDVTLTPEFLNSQTGTVQTLTARVLDSFGNPVRGVPVTFTSTGVGRFLDNTTSKVIFTDVNGNASVQVTTLVNETGTQTVTASIDPNTTACDINQNLADNGTTAQPGARQGDCTDVSTITYTTTQPTSAAPTTAAPTTAAPTTAAPTTAAPTTGAPTTPPGNLQCTNGTPAVVTLAANVTQITAGNSPTLTGTVQNTANQPCASVAITIFKKGYGDAGYTPVATVSTDQNGRFTLVVRPLVQTAYGANTANNAVRSNIVVIRVYTRVNINSPAVPVPATSARAVSNPVTFTGNLLPAYANVPVGLGTFINGRFVVLQQTRTNGSGGYSITRTLRPGTGVYVIFVSAHQGTDKGSKSITLSVS